MELEIGLKITQTRADITSTSTDLWIAKDKSGIIFLSKETETAFFLTAHLKGTHFSFSFLWSAISFPLCCNPTVQEKLMWGWILHKKEVELREFQKVFLIPKGVLLDNIKAKFEEDKSTLTIFMPKSVKGLTGQKIEEIKESQEDVKQEKHQKDHESVGRSKGRDQLEQAVERERTRSNLEKQLPYHREQAPQTDGSNKQLEKENEKEKPKTMGGTLDTSEEEKLRQREKLLFPPTSICRDPSHEVQNEEGEFQGSKSKLRQENLGGNVQGNQSSQLERIAHSPSSKPTVDDDKLHQFPQHFGDDDNNNAKPSRKRWNKCKLCNPAIAGSALLVTLLIIVAQLIRTKQK